MLVSQLPNRSRQSSDSWPTRPIGYALGTSSSARSRPICGQARQQPTRAAGAATRTRIFRRTEAGDSAGPVHHPPRLTREQRRRIWQRRSHDPSLRRRQRTSYPRIFTWPVTTAYPSACKWLRKCRRSSGRGLSRWRARAIGPSKSSSNMVGLLSGIRPFSPPTYD